MSAVQDVLTHLDLKKVNELQNALVHKLSEAPGSPVEGQIYYDTATHHLMVRGAASWIQADGLAITGGAGLVRTGDDLAVGAGTGITVNANDVAVDTSTIATRAYVDSTAQGLDAKASVKYATATALPTNTLAAGVLEATANGQLEVDSKKPEVGDRILVKAEGEGKKNGIYTVTKAGAAGEKYKLTRATDADAAGEITAGTYTYVESGSVNEASGWAVKTTGTITIDTTAIEWIQFSGAGQITAGEGLTKTGNTLDVGAGEGISLEADAVKINTAVVPRLGSENTFTGSQQTIKHNNGTWKISNGAGSIRLMLFTESDANGYVNAPGGDLRLGAKAGGAIRIIEGLQIKDLANPTEAQDAVTKAYVDARTYSASIGNGALTEITVEHKLGSEDVDVTVRYAGGTKALVDVAWAVSTTDKIILYFNSAPASEALRVKVSK